MIKLYMEVRRIKVGTHLKKIFILIIITLFFAGCSSTAKEKVDTRAILVQEVTVAFANGDRELLEEKVKIEDHKIDEYIEKWSESNISGKAETDFTVEKQGDFTYHVFETNKGKESGYVIFRVFEHLHTGFYVDYIQFVS